MSDGSARLPFVQSPRWRTGKDENGDAYADNRCCYCYRPTGPDAARLWLTRDDSGEWYVVASDAPVLDDERQLGAPHFTLPVGPDCLRKHPEWAFGVVAGAAPPRNFLVAFVVPTNRNTAEAWRSAAVEAGSAPADAEVVPDGGGFNVRWSDRGRTP